MSLHPTCLHTRLTELLLTRCLLVLFLSCIVLHKQPDKHSCSCFLENSIAKTLFVCLRERQHRKATVMWDFNTLKNHFKDSILFVLWYWITGKFLAYWLLLLIFLIFINSSHTSSLYSSQFLHHLCRQYFVHNAEPHQIAACAKLYCLVLLFHLS